MIRVPRPSRVSAYFAARLGPPVIEPDSVRAVLDRYGLQPGGGARNLRLGRRSRNMVVVTDRGRRVLKLYRPQWTNATVRYVHSILERLRELAVPAPRLARSLDGATWVETDDGLFALFGYLPGVNYSLNFLLRDDRLRLTTVAGSTLARLHRALDGFEPDGAHHLGFSSPTGPRRRDRTWHASKLEELKDRSLGLADRDAKALAGRLIGQAGMLLDEIETLDLALSEAGFPRLVIHGDYGIHNLLYQADGAAIPVDFELSRLDWRVNDLISALVKYRYSGGDYDFESMETFMTAYATVSALTEDERDKLADAWRLYKLQQAVQYWNSYFETDGPIRKLGSALDSIDQAEWVDEHPDRIRRLSRAAGGTNEEGRAGRWNGDRR